MSRNLSLCLGASAFIGIATSYGQVDTTEGAHVPGHGRVNAVNEREDKVEKMIADGVQSDALTADQAEGFKQRLNQIQADKTSDMIRHHGHLSKEEKKELERREKELERDIEASVKKS